MSEPIPESIPTSADPRTKRPVKKRALSPYSETATQISSLFSKPDQVLTVPSSASSSNTKHSNSQPPEIVQNVQGSSAGAGSGEFHVYKASRRREYERLRDMEEEVEREKDNEAWDRDKREREEKDREITRRKREKRERLKLKKGKGSKSQAVEKASGCGEGLKPRAIPREVEEPAAEHTASKTDVGEQVSIVTESGLIIHEDD